MATQYFKRNRQQNAEGIDVGSEQKTATHFCISEVIKGSGLRGKWTAKKKMSGTPGGVEFDEKYLL